MIDYLIIALLVILIITSVILIVKVGQLSQKTKGQNNRELIDRLTDFKRDLAEEQRGQRQELLSTSQSTARALSQQMSTQTAQMEGRLHSLSMENEQKLEYIRTTMEKQIANLQKENGMKLDQMRQVVDTRLQKTLEDTMTQSFGLVNQRLKQVYEGLGEMRTLASGVGNLKKVLSNVKTRGILGEIQLGAILDEILAPQQFETNFATKKGSKNVVEFAIKLPTEDGSPIYLPIDSKFPGDAYAQLQNAIENGSREEITAMTIALKNRIKASAKDIRDKYIDPPNTTDFAIMFLPFEGLYAQVVSMGMVEVLQREYRINIAGPSTMAALLNSLQMSFRTFAIQKRSGEVWQVLGAVKTEFDRFASVLEATQMRIGQAEQELDKLVGVRTRVIQKRLIQVTALGEEEHDLILPQNVNVD